MNSTTKNILIGAAVLAVGYMAWQYYQKQKAQTVVNQPSVPSTNPQTQVPSGNGIQDVITGAQNTLDALQNVFGG